MTFNFTAATKAIPAILAAVALGLTGLLGAGIANGATTRVVHIKNTNFSPHVLKVSRGTTVRWTFEDKATPHNVTSRGSKHFQSSHTQQSGSYSVRFTKAGTYHYVCTIHFNMKASIVVH